MELFFRIVGIDILYVTMLIGLIGTLFPHFPGNLLILTAAIIYGFLTDFVSFETWMLISLVLLVIIGEIGTSWLRKYLTRRYPLSPLFSANSTAGNIAGIVASDALLGTTLGVLLWELVAGKTLFPRFDTIAQVLGRLAAAAIVRLVCGIIMMVIIYVYIVI